MRDEEPRIIPRSLVSVVDDDESVRESLPDLLREFGYAARTFSSAEEFLGSDCVDHRPKSSLPPNTSVRPTV